MAEFGTYAAGWHAAGTGGRFFGPSYGFKTPASIQNQANDYDRRGDNSSPIGRTIPAGVGMVVHRGDLVIDPKHLGGYRESGDKVLCNLVFCVVDNLLAGPFSLVWIRANNEFIVRNEAPHRTINSPYRFYGGDQTAVDPIIAQYLPAEDRTAWPGFCYIVFEDFDIAPYGNKIPVFDFHVASSVTTIPATEEQSALTFGPYPSGDYNYPLAVDTLRGLHYQIVGASGAGADHISTIDIATNREVGRSTIFGAVDFDDIMDAVALEGSDFIAASALCGSFQELSLINAATGEIVARLAPETYNGTTIEMATRCAVLLESAASTKYLVFCWGIFGDWAQSNIGVALADVTNGTLDWIAHPSLNPVSGTTANILWSIAPGPVADGSATFFYTEIEYGSSVLQPEVQSLTVNAAGFTQATVYSESDSAKDPKGVAYDPTDGTIVLYREDGSFKKIASDGSSRYATSAQTPTDLLLNYWNTASASGLFYRARPGYVIAIRDSGDDIYQVDLSNGSMTRLIDMSTVTNYDTFHYFDQYTGVMTEGSEVAGIINKVTLGNVTPNQVDLEDILLALSSFEGRLS